VFVDECHRTQSGKLHDAMKAILPNAIFIGFTGTPLLKKDKQTSLEIFGTYIHTYKFNEAVADKVVLDLRYEARDIDQHITDQQSIDEWFEAETKGLTPLAKAELKKRWGTLRKLFSSKGRLEKIVIDIIKDFKVKDRLSTGQGNAMLVAGSVYEACKFYELFVSAGFNECAIVTSYEPNVARTKGEDTGEGSTEELHKYDVYQRMLKGKSTEDFEKEAKRLFINEPARMKLLIVVDKLLTGFDAPAATYLYIDKSMQDHGLFQAVCRVNRLHGEDKEFGYIVDYKDLFKNLVNEKGTGALQVYTAELDHPPGTEGEPEIMMNQRLAKGKERLDNALEAIALLCEPVPLPKTELHYIHYFCGNVELPEDLKAHEPQRAALYKAVVALVRAYANIADELEAAGYSKDDIDRIKRDLDRYLKLREVIRKASGETIDLKAYEADMRHLLDTYIQADEPRKISPFDDLSLLELMEKTGMDAAIASLPEGIRKSKDAIAETIANNVRSKIIKDHLNDPAFYERMSVLLTEILSDLHAKRIEYEEYLKRIAQLAKRVNAGQAEDTPTELRTPGLRALYNNLLAQPDNSADNLAAEHAAEYGAGKKGKALAQALRISEAVRAVRPDAWRGVKAREQVIKAAINTVLSDAAEVERIFLIIFEQREF
jgi:type I restriction enzyme R subunit